MATYWVRPAPDGSDANDGSSYVLAKATLSGALAIAGVATNPGHTINIVASGNHVMEAFPATAVAGVGTNYTNNAGIIIRGVLDATEAPAVATVAAETGKRIWVRIAGAANYTLIQGIKFDYSALAGDTTNAKVPINYNLFSGAPSSRNHRVHDCELWFSSGTTVGSGVSVAETLTPSLVVYNGTSGITSGLVDIYNCVFVHSRLSVNALVGTDVDIHHNVIVWDATSTGSANQHMIGLPGTPATNIRVFNNTFVQLRYGSTRNTACFYDTATDRPVLSFYDNLMYNECSATAASPGLIAFLAQGATQAVSSGGAVSNNAFITGTNLSAFIAGAWNNQTNGYTSFQLNDVWRGGDTVGWLGTDVEAASLAATNTAFADTFYDTSVTYNWTPGTYTHTLPYDLRPRLGVTTSTTGAYVGAIESSPPTAVDDDYNVAAGATLVVPAATGVLDNDSDLGGLTMTAVLDTDATLGTLTLNSDGGFTFDAAGLFNTTVTFTYKAVNSALLESEVATVTITVADTVPVVVDDEDPVVVVGHNFLDSYPFYKPLIKADITAMVRILRNKTYNHVDLRHYLRDHVHDESTQRVVQLAASATFTCGFGGVYRAKGVLLVTDQELSVTVTHYNGTTDSTFTVTVDQLLMLDGCQVTQLAFTNNSTSTACVQVVAFD